MDEKIWRTGFSLLMKNCVRFFFYCCSSVINTNSYRFPAPLSSSCQLRKKKKRCRIQVSTHSSGSTWKFMVPKSAASSILKGICIWHNVITATARFWNGLFLLFHPVLPQSFLYFFRSRFLSLLSDFFSFQYLLTQLLVWVFPQRCLQSDE